MDAKGNATGFDLSGFGKPSHLELFNPFNPAVSELKQYDGTYYSDELETSYVIATTEDQLKIKIGRMPLLPLKPVVKDSFSSGGLGAIKFVRDGSGNIKGFALSAGRAQGILFEKK